MKKLLEYPPPHDQKLKKNHENSKTIQVFTTYFYVYYDNIICYTLY